MVTKFFLGLATNNELWDCLGILTDSDTNWLNQNKKISPKYEGSSMYNVQYFKQLLGVIPPSGNVLMSFLSTLIYDKVSDQGSICRQ